MSGCNHASPILPSSSSMPGVRRDVHYVGFRAKTQSSVWVCIRAGVSELRGKDEKANTRFDWGNSDVGASELSFAILFHFSGGEEFAAKHQQRFMQHVISRLPISGWELSSSAIAKTLLATSPNQEAS